MAIASALSALGNYVSSTRQAECGDRSADAWTINDEPFGTVQELAGQLLHDFWRVDCFGALPVGHCDHPVTDLRVPRQTLKPLPAAFEASAYCL